MKKAEMELDLVHDKAKIFGKEVPLQNTTSVHYIASIKQTLILIEQSIFISQDIKEKEKMVIKFHKQFTHPSAKRLKLCSKMQEYMTVIVKRYWINYKKHVMYV